MKFPKYIYIPLLASALFLGSCKEKEKNIVLNVTEIIDSDALSLYIIIGK